MKRIKFINEGGNAFKQLDVRGVKQNEVGNLMDLVTEKIFDKMGIKEGDYMLIGSAGKKLPDQLSGDLDVAIFIPTFLYLLEIEPGDKKEFYSALEKYFSLNFPYDYSIQTGLGVFSIAFPYKDYYVQVDLMPTDDMNWSSFAYHSPDFTKLESKYKSLYRNFALSAVASAHIFEKTYDGENLKEVKLFSFNIQEGLNKITKNYFSEKTGKPIKNAKTTFKELVSRDPDEVVKLLFGEKFTVDDVDTFEHIMEVLQDPDFIMKDSLEYIYKSIAYSVNAKDLPIPEEIPEKYRP